VSLTLNGVPVSGSPVSVTLNKGQEINVKFTVTFTTPGNSVLTATLSPSDVNPANDTKTKTVKVKNNGKDKDK
jgi:hypothetical protein